MPSRRFLLLPLLLVSFTHAAAPDRSPVDLALSPDGRWLVSANETSDSISLLDTQTNTVADEAKCGRRPAAVAIGPAGKTVLVSGAHSGDVSLLEISAGKLLPQAVIEVGFEPHGIAFAPDGKKAYVALEANAQVAEIDLEKRKVARRFDVKRWPRRLAVTPDGKRLAVGCSGDETIVVVDTQSGETLYQQRVIAAVNFGHMQMDRAGKYVYFPWMIYRNFPVTRFNITQGWVLASRIARLKMDGPNPHEKFSLDPRGKAIADPHGIALNADETRLVATASGTHELLVYRLKDLPFRDFGATSDHIDRRLLGDSDRFSRIPLGGRPMAVRFAPDGKTVYVANYLKNSVQIVDILQREILQEIPLGGSPEASLARRGAAIFYDGQRSLNQWYSCHSCHYNGGSNSRPMDTMNDGSQFTAKTVLPLDRVQHTAPWTWHGWQQDLRAAMHKSLRDTMLGPTPQENDAEALLAFLGSLKQPPNPFREKDGSMTAAALRGKAIFHGAKAGCASCHNGPQFTDGKIHDVGTGSEEDKYQGYNTPSLIGVHRKVRLLHHGRGRSLEAVLNKYHRPENVAGEGKLSEQETRDLIEYLKSL